MKKSNNINQGVYEIVKTASGEVIGYKLRYSVPVAWGVHMKSGDNYHELHSPFITVRYTERYNKGKAVYIREFPIYHWQQMQETIAWIKMSVALFKANEAQRELENAYRNYMNVTGQSIQQPVNQSVEEPFQFNPNEISLN